HLPPGRPAADAGRRRRGRRDPDGPLRVPADELRRRRGRRPVRRRPARAAPGRPRRVRGDGPLGLLPLRHEGVFAGLVGVLSLPRLRRLGWWLLRRTENPVRIGATTL